MTFRLPVFDAPLSLLWRDSRDVMSPVVRLDTLAEPAAADAVRAVRSSRDVEHVAQREPGSEMTDGANGAAGRMLQARDDVIDVKLDLYPSGTQGFSMYDKLMGSTYHVRENYDFTLPKEGRPTGFSVSYSCANSILGDDGYVQVPGRVMSFSELMDAGKLNIVSPSFQRGEVTFRDMPAGKAMLVCNNQGAVTKVAPGATAALAGSTSRYDYDFKPHHTAINQNDTLTNFDGYRTRNFFADGDEGYYDGGTWGRLVEGKYGFLAIHDHGLVQYVPRADPSVIGKVDVFPYKVAHPTVGASDANIIVRIGSDQADVEWDENNLNAPARKADVWDYSSSAVIKVLGETTIETKSGACSYNWDEGHPTHDLGVTGQAFEFTVGDGSLTRITIDIYAETLPWLLDEVQVVCFRKGQASESTPFHSETAGKMVFSKIGESHLQALTGELDAGTYVVYVANQRPVQSSGYVDVDLMFETTRFTAVDTRPASGNVFIEEGLDAGGAKIVLTHGDGSQNVISQGGARLVGEHGFLTLQADGDYVYQPNADLGAIAEFDTFRYQLRLADGSIKDARLTIAIRMANGEIDDTSEDADVSIDAQRHFAMDDEAAEGGQLEPSVAHAEPDDLIGSALAQTAAAPLIEATNASSIFPTNPIPIARAPQEADAANTSALMDALDHSSSSIVVDDLGTGNLVI